MRARAQASVSMSLCGHSVTWKTMKTDAQASSAGRLFRTRQRTARSLATMLGAVSHCLRLRAALSGPSERDMSEAAPYRITPEILSLVEDIGEGLGRAEALGIARDLRLRRISRIRSIRGSLAIEGNTLSEEQVATLLDGKPVIGSLREIQEARNAIKAYDRFESWSPGSEADLLRAHGVLMAGLLDRPGRYRSRGVAVGGAGVVHHVAPPAGRVPELMAALLHWVLSTGDHPLIVSSVFHDEFELIHPFEDGNGRLGRLWQTLILTRWRPLFAHLPVESLVHAHQSAYYGAIRASSAAGESTPFVTFMLQMIRAALAPAVLADQAARPGNRSSSTAPRRAARGSAKCCPTAGEAGSVPPPHVARQLPAPGAGAGTGGDDPSRISHRQEPGLPPDRTRTQSRRIVQSRLLTNCRFKNGISSRHVDNANHGGSAVSHMKVSTLRRHLADLAGKRYYPKRLGGVVHPVCSVAARPRSHPRRSQPRGIGGLSRQGCGMPATRACRAPACRAARRWAGRRAR